MLHIGCHLSVSDGYTNMIKDALSIDADTFAFFTRNPRGGAIKVPKTSDIEEFNTIYKDNNFAKLIAHAPYTYNLCSAKEDVVRFATQAMIEDLEKMELTPYNFYNFHPGSHVGQGSEKGIEMVVNALNKILKKDMNTIVLLETMSGKGSEIGCCFEEIREIINGVELKDKLGVCLDTCHISDAGYDIINDLDGVMEEFDDIIGLNYLYGIHINDSMNEPGSHKDRHAPIGEGTLGIKTFESIVNHKALKDLPFVLETPHKDLESYAKEIKLLRSLAS